MKLLYFFPENPLEKSQGNNARAYELLNYFKERAFEVDFVSIEEENFSENDINNLKNEKLITNGYLLSELNKKNNKVNYFWDFSLPKKFNKKVRKFYRCRFGHLDAFNTILKSNKYDIIIISYTCWAELIKDNKYLKNAKLFIDTHDLLTAQFQNCEDFNLGNFFQTEIELLNNFDYILAISAEEAYLYSQFTNKKVEIITHSLPDKSANSSMTKTIDILYVASDNEHNRIAASWFFDKVYPLLQSCINIVVIGKITDHFLNYENVQKIKFAKDLDYYYSSSKIAICPMLTGTGLKIKVIEAMSHGLPIVCNERGVDGLLNKTKNGCLVTNDEKQFANYIHKLINDENYYQVNSNDSKEYFLSNNLKSKVYERLDKLFKF